MTKLAQVGGSPDSEHKRSPAARRTATLAAQSNLFLSHFEHRVWLGAPRSWLGPDAEAIATPSWRGGVLAEPKYLVFRNDGMVGSFHPLHRAKWTGHELCHRLVGYGYTQGASPLWNVLAAWAAELLPVALWYFFDEAGLARCERHAGYGPLFGAHCHTCEQAALRGHARKNRRRTDDEWIEQGRRYVREELEAIERSMKRGKPIGTRHASIHLASDALGYVAAHHTRLAAPEMERFVANFVSAEQGCHASLESLLERVQSACSAILDDAPLSPWRATHWDWVAQDIGYRLLTVHAQLTDPGKKRALDPIIASLAGARSEQGVSVAIRAYQGLTAGRRERWAATEDVFAVGYSLPGGWGRSGSQIRAGIQSALPSTCEALGKRLHALIASFLAQELAVRRPIGLRFADFLERAAPGPIADFARAEAHIVHARSMDAFASALGSSAQPADGKVMLSPSAEILRLDHNVLDAAPRALGRCRKLATPRFLVVSRTATEQVDLIDLPETAAKRLQTRRALVASTLGLTPSTLDELLALGVLVRERYRL